jgi:lipoprotein-anchoring transpeptidase ErfK/SrfK
MRRPNQKTRTNPYFLAVLLATLLLVVVLLLALVLLPQVYANRPGNPGMALSAQSPTPVHAPTPEPSVTPSPTPDSPTPTATEDKTPTATTTPTPIFETDENGNPYELPYVLYVEKGSHTITVYGKADDGSYTKVIHQFLTATGKTAGRTPTGTFYIGKKERWHKFGDEAYAQYCSSYRSGMYIHSALYMKKNNRAMYLNTYREIGTNVTAGCLRTYCGAAYWIYTNCDTGTKMYIVNGSPKETKAEDPPSLVNNNRYDPTDPEITEPPATTNP